VLAQGMTRRAFVRRSGFAFGVAGALRLSWPAAAPASGPLSVARAATYGALFTVVQEANGAVVDTAVRSAAVSRFGDDYLAVDGSTQAYIDQVLDEIEGSQTGGFSNAQPAVQIQTLEQWGTAAALPDPTDSSETAQRHLAFAAEALVWATSPSALTADYRVTPLPI
jgi:hypothetical protein